jgi:uncharacterized membrane protein
MWQVLATGGVPCLLCILSFLPSFQARASSTLYRAYVSCCSGDTLASEIGILATQPPVSALDRRLTRPGVDGGITMLGSFAAFVGGAVIGLCELSLTTALRCGAYGIIGSFFDSIIGALLQAQLFLLPAASLQKNSPEFISLARRWKTLNNIVNVLSSLLMAGAAYTVQLMHEQRQVDEDRLLALGSLAAFALSVPVLVRVPLELRPKQQ